ncbi:MAG: hypothetical protein WBP42_08785 [Candidatus Zixiibacteriota bacterium]
MKEFADRNEHEYPRGVVKDQDALLAFYNYPQPHWLLIKAANPIESVFAIVKLRTNAARRITSPRSALYLLYQHSIAPAETATAQCPGLDDQNDRRSEVQRWNRSEGEKVSEFSNRKTRCLKISLHNY